MDLQALLTTIDFAAKKHKDQIRKDNVTPYINHPIGVAQILSSEGGITELSILQAAILHDTVEHTDTTFEEIEKEFGSFTKSIIEEVTIDKKFSKEEQRQLQLQNAPHLSRAAKLIKLADKLYNLRDLKRRISAGLSSERSVHYYAVSAQIVEGLKGVNKTLEDKLDEIFRPHLL